MKTFQAAVAMVTGLMWVNMAGAVTVSDPTDWTSGWVYSTVETTGVGTANFAVEPVGGNPGARLRSTTITPAAPDTAFGAAVYTGMTLPAPTAGTTFVMKLDTLSGAGGFGQGQAVQALVSQGGSLYQANVGITGFPLNTFTSFTFPGTFGPASFTKIAGPGPATPAFDGVTPTNFGFAVGNNMSATLIQYYDNWSITYAVAAVVPAEPARAIPALSASMLIVLALLVALVAVATRKGWGKPG